VSEVPLPTAVRLRVTAIAAEALGSIPADEIPQSLRQVARFAPTKRARAGGRTITAGLTSDPKFRQQVAARLRDLHEPFAVAIESGQPPADADAVEVAAFAYLLRFEGWEDVLAAQSARLARAEQERLATRDVEAVQRLRDELDAVRSQSRHEVDKARSELDAVRAELATLKRDLRSSQDAHKGAEALARQAAAAADEARADANTSVGALEAELRRLRGRLADTEAAVEAARKAAREGRNVDDVRLRLLIDTLVEAAQGVRRELALPPATIRPADAIGALSALSSGVDDISARGLSYDDPSVLDQLLALPQVHLVVDGYNVTKTGYGSLPLDAQRSRLLSALGALAARSGAEVTCVFDGAALDAPVAVPGHRGVRVLFSSPGESADELIRRLVRAEPPGRPVVVVSSDREVADGVRAANARPVPAIALLRRIERG
jgi:predicted RNA-binding protein with PIN domain